MKIDTERKRADNGECKSVCKDTVLNPRGEVVRQSDCLGHVVQAQIRTTRVMPDWAKAKIIVAMVK